MSGTSAQRRTDALTALGVSSLRLPIGHLTSGACCYPRMALTLFARADRRKRISLECITSFLG